MTPISKHRKFGERVNTGRLFRFGPDYGQDQDIVSAAMAILQRDERESREFQLHVDNCDHNNNTSSSSIEMFQHSSHGSSHGFEGSAVAVGLLAATTVGATATRDSTTRIGVVPRRRQFDRTLWLDKETANDFTYHCDLVTNILLAK